VEFPAPAVGFRIFILLFGTSKAAVKSL